MQPYSGDALDSTTTAARRTDSRLPTRRRTFRPRRALRKGALFSLEMMMGITVLIPLLFALTEFSLLWSAKHTLQAASYEAARAAAMPCPDDETRFACAKEAADSVFANERFLDEEEGYEFEVFQTGAMTNDPVRVKLKLPMTTAAPDLLAIIGISIEGKHLTAETVTRRE